MKLEFIKQGPYKKIRPKFLPQGFKRVTDKKHKEMLIEIQKKLASQSDLSVEDKNILKMYNFQYTDLKSQSNNESLNHQIGFAIQNFYYLGANPTADCAIMHNKKILLIKRGENGAEPGKWAIPGGFIDSTCKYGENYTLTYEQPIDAALRELKEETSCIIDPKDIEMTKDFNDDQKKIQCVSLGYFEGNNRDPRDNEYGWSQSYVFAFNMPDKFFIQQELKIDPNEVAECDYFSLEQIKEMEIAFDHKEIILKTFNLLPDQDIKNKIAKIREQADNHNKIDKNKIM